MGFLRNAWYAAGWASELGDAPLARTILGEPVALFRDEAGTPVAIGGRCPHRFAPLGQGKMVNGHLQCPYHGLEFDRTGACVHNPHGDGKIPAAARVPAYTVAEAHGVVWLWMGDADHADPAEIVDIDAMIDETDTYATAVGYLHVRANYQLVVDNLLDLSHAQYLHPLLGAGVDFAGEFPDQRQETKQDGEAIWAYNYLNNFPVTPFYRLQWGEDLAPKRGDMRAHMRWDAPGILQLDTGMTVKGGSVRQGPSAPSVHLITPETETTAHYFWRVSHNAQVDNAQITALVKAAIADAFENEDEPMIAAVQELMGGVELMELRPVLLQTDAAALRARRILQGKIEAEAPQAAR